MLRCPFAERGWLRLASQARIDVCIAAIPMVACTTSIHVKGSGDSPAYPHMPDRDVARPRRTALTRSEELSEDGTRNLSASGPNGGWSGDTAYAGFLSITNPEPHAKTPIDAAMIRKTNPTIPSPLMGEG